MDDALPVHRGRGRERAEGHVPSDDELGVLLTAVATGCSRSFTALYERTSQRLLVVVQGVLNHRGQAEEVLQEIYLRIWIRSAQFDPTRGLAIGWLTAIARRAAIDTYRRNACRPLELVQSDDADDRMVSAADLGPGPEGRCLQAQAAMQTRQVLLLLSLEQRQMILLAFAEDLAYSEIATRLACPLSTVKSRMRRALLEMRRMWSSAIPEQALLPLERSP